MASDTELEKLLRTGVICLDKPQGPTSHQVTAWVRDIFGVEKAGHGGTLDPNVTGVLVIALGDSARGLGVLLEGTKEYVGILKLHRKVPKDRIRTVFEEFKGPIYQTPPVRSAVKRQLRVREIFKLDILEINDRDVLFRTVCEGGTYIRTLCVDIGDALGVGGSMLELRRTRTGGFPEKQAVTLHQLKDAYETWKDGDAGPLMTILQPMERLLSEVPQVIVKDSAVDAICHGSNLAVPGVMDWGDNVKKGGVVALLTNKGEGIALGKALIGDANSMPKKGWVVRVERVLMEPGTYPKGWKTKE